MHTSPFDPWALGASLYAPATRSDLLELGTDKIPGLTSIIYCTEDAIREDAVPHALENLRRVLPLLPAGPHHPLRLIRARNPDVLAQLIQLDLRGIHGFVLPKVEGGNLGRYLRLLEQGDLSRLLVFPTLETREALSEHRMALLRDLIFQENWQGRIPAFRIGGNDLMHALGVRRAPGRTVYEGPLERVISMLVGVFKPYGFHLSSPVYEVFSDLVTLEREVRQDLEYGLCGKTIIHPGQLGTVLRGYAVPEHEVEEARAILDEHAPAVFQMNGRMCEPATHREWAQTILSRAARFGSLPEPHSAALHF